MGRTQNKEMKKGVKKKGEKECNTQTERQCTQTVKKGN